VRSIGLLGGWPTTLLLSVLAAVTTTFAGAASVSAQTQPVMRWGSFGTPPGAQTPTGVESLANVTAISASNASAYALESNGTVWAWGNNRGGQLGEGNESSPFEAEPVPLPANLKFTAIGEAEFVGIAIDSAGHAWAWGEGGPAPCLSHYGGYETPPTEVPGISNAVAVSGGGHHTIWLLSNGTVEACGNNAQGQLGVPEVDGSSTPVPVPGLSDGRRL